MRWHEVPLSAGIRLLSSSARSWLLLALVIYPGCAREERSRLEKQLLLEAAVCNTPTVRELLQRGANIESRGEDGAVTPLLRAASGGCAETVAFLLEEGAEIEAATPNGSTALLLAAQKGERETVNKLLNSGANPDAKDDKGWTALMFASYNGNLEIIRSVIDAGAHINMRNYAGRTALDLTGHKPPAPQGADVKKYTDFSVGSRPEAAEVLLNRGATVAR